LEMMACSFSPSPCPELKQNEMRKQRLKLLN
jgi:hypothetical protein